MKGVAAGVGLGDLVGAAGGGFMGLGQRLGARAVTQELQAPVGDDAVQPGRERAVAPEAGKPLPGLDEGILGDILGIVGVGEHAQGDPVDAALVALDEHLERTKVTPSGPGDQVGVVELLLHGRRCLARKGNALSRNRRRQMERSPHEESGR